MPEEATLDAFVPDGEADGDREDADGTDQGDGGAAPAAVTSAWEDGGTCAACGAAAGRLWVADEGRLCTACKSWA